jgi:hypothetical protein
MDTRKPELIAPEIVLYAAYFCLLNCVEESYGLSEEDATWLAADIIYKQSKVIEANPPEKAILFTAIEGIKNAFKDRS